MTKKKRSLGKALTSTDNFQEYKNKNKDNQMTMELNLVPKAISKKQFFCLSRLVKICATDYGCSNVYDFYKTFIFLSKNPFYSNKVFYLK